MTNPKRVMWLLAGGIAFATIPSIVAYATHSLWICRLMFMLFIPFIYFYIGAVLRSAEQSGALSHAQHFHRHLFAGRQRIQSDCRGRKAWRS